MNEAPAEVKSGRKLFSKINDTLNLNLIISQAYILNMPKKNEKQKEKTEENTKKKRRGREGGGREQYMNRQQSLLLLHFINAFQHENLKQTAANSL